MPAWLVAPVLRLAIPDSPFGRGSAGGALPAPAEDATAAAVPELADTAEAPPAVVREVSDKAEPAPAPEPDAATAADAAGEPRESLAAALARGISAEAAAPSLVVLGETEAPAPLSQLPLSAGEVRPATRELRSERLAGASQAPLRPEPAGAAASVGNGAVPPGLPAADLPPVMVEPQDSGAELAEPTQAPVFDNRPTMRNRRLYRRVGFDAVFEIDGIAAKLIDLSMGGFAAANGPELEPRTVVPVSLRWSIDGVDIGTRMRARVIHGDGARCGGRFVDLTGEQTAFLRYVVTWRNQAVGALGTTTLLDAITRTPSRPQAAEFLPPSEPARKTPWWSRLFGRFRPRRGEAE